MLFILISYKQSHESASPKGVTEWTTSNIFFQSVLESKQDPISKLPVDEGAE